MVDLEVDGATSGTLSGGSALRARCDSVWGALEDSRTVACASTDVTSATGSGRSTVALLSHSAHGVRQAVLAPLFVLSLALSSAMIVKE